MESVYDNSDRVRYPTHFKLPTTFVDTSRLKEMASESQQKPMQKVELFNSTSISETLDHPLGGYLIKCGDCVAVEHNQTPIMGRVVHILKATSFDGDFETILTIRPFISHKNKLWANKSPELWMTTPKSVTHTIEVVLTFEEADAFDSKSNSMCVVLSGFYERDEYDQIHATPFTATRNPQQWQYWQRICDARVVDGCEKKLEEYSEKLEIAQFELRRLRKLLKFALVDWNRQTSELKELVRKADKSHKHWDELLEDREEEKMSEECEDELLENRETYTDIEKLLIVRFEKS